MTEEENEVRCLCRHVSIDAHISVCALISVSQWYLMGFIRDLKGRAS